MTTASHPDTFAVAVVNTRLSDAERLAQAMDRVRERTDLVRPYRVLVNAAVAETMAAPEGVEVVGFGFIPATQFRFVQEGKA